MSGKGYDGWVDLESHPEKPCSLQTTEIDGKQFYRVEDDGYVTDYTDYNEAKKEYEKLAK